MWGTIGFSVVADVSLLVYQSLLLCYSTSTCSLAVFWELLLSIIHVSLWLQQKQMMPQVFPSHFSAMGTEWTSQCYLSLPSLSPCDSWASACDPPRSWKSKRFSAEWNDSGVILSLHTWRTWTFSSASGLYLHLLTLNLQGKFLSWMKSLSQLW